MSGMGMSGMGTTNPTFPVPGWYHPRRIRDPSNQGTQNMRTILLLAWCAAPIAGLAYHYGPGQERLVLDDVAGVLARAESAAQDENWGEAVDRYDEALKQLPADQTLMQRRLKLERAKAALLDSKLPTATADLS